MSKNRYSAEFKKEAARLIIIEGMSVAETSKKLGVRPAQLYKWRDAHMESISGEAAESGQASGNPPSRWTSLNVSLSLLG
jgi:transposase